MKSGALNEEQARNESGFSHGLHTRRINLREEGRGKREEGKGKREKGKGKREKGKGKREKGKGKRPKNQGQRDEAGEQARPDCLPPRPLAFILFPFPSSLCPLSSSLFPLPFALCPLRLSSHQSCAQSVSQLLWRMDQGVDAGRCRFSRSERRESKATGLTRWWSNPASRARIRSCSCP
jgi:hypothetical protein